MPALCVYTCVCVYVVCGGEKWRVGRAVESSRETKTALIKKLRVCRRLVRNIYSGTLPGTTSIWRCHRNRGLAVRGHCDKWRCYAVVAATTVCVQRQVGRIRGPVDEGKTFTRTRACERRRRLRQCHNATQFDPNVRAGMPTTEGSIEKAPSPLMLDVCVLDRKSPTCSRLHGLHGMASEKGRC